MKKTIIVLLCILVAILTSLYVYYQSTQNNLEKIKKFNLQFEQYFDKEFLGSEAITLINKAIDNNVTYNISKNQNGKYNDGELNCLKVIVKFKGVDTLYEMESIDKAGMDGFIKNFSTSIFKISDYNYNNVNNRIAKLVIEEVKIGNI